MKTTSPWLDTVPDKNRFPALQGSANADVIIIGGGLCGLMSAWQLVKQGRSVIIIEKNHIATGDTGQTTGFLTRVPDASIALLGEAYGVEFVQKLFAETFEAQADIFRIIKDEQLDCDFVPCDSYYGSYQETDTTIDKEWPMIKAANTGAEILDTPSQNGFPFKKAIRFPNEGKWHVRKFLLNLLQTETGKKIKIFEETEAVDLIVAERVVVKTTAGPSAQIGMAVGKKLVMAMGNPASLVPELAQLLTEKITYVIAARFADQLLAPHVFWDTMDPYFYYRTIADRTMVIGGCDIEADRTHEQEPFTKLARFATDHFGGTFTVTNQWSGSIFHTKDGLPYVFPHPHYGGKIFVATGFGGNGMIGSVLSASVIKDMVMGETHAAADLLSLKRTGFVVPARVMRVPTTTGHKAFVPVAKLSEFGNRRMLCKELAGKKITLFKIREQYYALSNTCTHAGGSLCEGTLDDTTIQCPLHGAKFDVTSGAVVGPPAIRSVQKYPVRVNGEVIEVEIAVASNLPGAAESDGAEPSKHQTHWKSFLLWIPIVAAFWYAEFVTQYYWLIRGEIGGSLIRSFALAAATLFGLALFSSAIFKWFPKLSDYWRLRRYLGVTGFIFAAGHVFSVTKFFFNYDIRSIYYSFNPLKNPIIFGSIAFPIFMVMAATSTDWAVDKLGYRKWKSIHRLVYIAYLSSIFHFIAINPMFLKNPPGVLLLGVTALALIGELYWFFRTAIKKPRSWGTLYGLALVATALVMAYFVYHSYFIPT